jgi:hypothetical protein
VTETKNTAADAKKAEPAATPSAPSSRLNAFAMPTSHTVVTSRLTGAPSVIGPVGNETT